MERWLPTALAGLALLLGAWNAWSLADLSARLDDAEIGAPAALRSEVDDSGAAAGTALAREARRPTGATERLLAAKEAPAGASEAGPLAVDDPAFHEKVASVLEAEEERRDAERRARFEERMRSEIETFADEEGLDEPTTQALLAQFAARSEAFRAIRDDIRDGTISWAEGHDEMEALREEADAETEKLIGAERAERLEGRLWGGRGPGGGPGPMR